MTAHPTTVPTDASAWINHPAHWPGQGDLLVWCQNMDPGTATLLIMAGIVYLLFGYHAFKVLIALNAALLGAWIGAVIGVRAGSLVGGAVVGSLLAVALAWPFMKYAIAFMGGLYGCLVGVSIWRATGLPPDVAWAGAMVGLIAFGLLAFVLFRGSIIMFTSLQGATMLIFGVLGLVYKYNDVVPHVNSRLILHPFILPLAIFIPAVFGLVYQQMQYPAAPAAPAKK